MPLLRFFSAVILIGLLGNTATSICAQDLLWINRTSPPTAQDLRQVVYLNNLFVAFGERGTLLTSPDGVVWTPRRVPSPTRLLAITYGNGRYLASDRNGTIWTSGDAVTWASVGAVQENSFVLETMLAFGHGTFVRGNPASSTLEFSIDGVSWQQAQTDTGTAPEAASGFYFPSNRGALEFKAGKFFFLGFRGRMWSSTDGRSWRSIDLGADVTLTQLAYGNGRLVVAQRGPSGGYFVSGTGDTWTHYTSPAIDVVNFVNDRFYAQEAETGNLLTSSDGLVWTPLATPASPISAIEAAYGAGRYVTIRQESPFQLLTSTDGAVWSDIYPPRLTGAGTGIAFGNGLYVSGNLTSPDGVTWTANGFTVPDPSYKLQTVFCHDRFFFIESDLIANAPSRPRRVYMSLDGRTAANVFSLSSDRFGDIAFGNGQFVLAAEDAWRSTDGINWLPTSRSPMLRLVAFGGNQFVGSDGARLYTSPNGLDWTERYSELPSQSLYPVSITQIAFGQGRFVAIRSTSGKSIDSFTNSVLVSTDGVTWDPVAGNLGTVLNGLTFANGMFIVGATGAESQTASFQYVLTSLDGYAWQRQSVNESGFRGFAGNAGVFVATNGVDLFQASLGASAAPLIAASQISPAVLTRERSTALSVTAAGIGPFTYQWRRDGVPIHGANQPSYTVMANSVTTVSGQYDVVVSNATGSVVSASATITVDDSWLTNLSSRAYVGLGEDQLIQGFVIRTRDVSVAYRLLARAVGPGLTPLGVHEVLANPYLKLYRQIDQAQISENDDWSSSGMQPSLSYYFDAVGASPLPSGSADAALLPTLSSGAYSLGVTGVNGGSGIALSELYDLELSPGRLVNLSARARVGTGDRTLIVGFVIAGGKPLKVLIRGIGPTLTGLGVVHALADPKLTLFNSAGREIRNNDNWSQATNADDIRSAMTATGAFRLSDGSLDAALLETLEPGIYTAHVTSADGISSGVALAEIYEAR